MLQKGQRRWSPKHFRVWQVGHYCHPQNGFGEVGGVERQNERKVGLGRTDYLLRPSLWPRVSATGEDADWAR